VLTLIRAGRMIEGTRSAPQQDMELLVDGDRIVGLFPANGAPVARPDRRVDIQGGTLLPGLIDCHVHLFLQGDPEPSRRFREEPEGLTMARGLANARATLEAGFTTVRVTVRQTRSISYSIAPSETASPQARGSSAPVRRSALPVATDTRTDWRRTGRTPCGGRCATTSKEARPSSRWPLPPASRPLAGGGRAPQRLRRMKFEPVWSKPTRPRSR